MEPTVSFVMRRYLIIFLSPALLLIILLAAWSARLYLAERLVTVSMEQVGLEDINAGIDQLDLNQTQLSQLDFVLSSESGQLTLDARDINIHYLPDDLVDGNVDRLEIERLNLQYQHDTVPPPQQQGEVHPVIAIAQLSRILAALRLALDEYLYLNKLVIHHISLNGEAFAQLDGKSLSLISNKSDDGIDATLSFLNDGLAENSATQAAETEDNRPTLTPRLIISRLSKDELNAELRLTTEATPTASQLPAKIDLELSDTAISGNYQLSTAALQDWLQEAVGIDSIAVLDILSGSHGQHQNRAENHGQDHDESAILSGTLSLNAENDELLNASISSTMKHLTVDPVQAENIRLELKLAYSTAEAVHKLALLDGSYLNMDKFITGDTAFTSSPIKLGGVLSISDQHRQYQGWQYKGNLSTDQLSIESGSQQIALANITTDVTADAQQLQIAGQLSPATLPGRFALNLKHDLTNNSGKVALRPTTAIELDSEDHKLSKLLTPWPYPFDLYTGSINLLADAAWFNDKKTRLSIDIDVQNSGGLIKDIVFSGLSFEHKLEILPAIKSADISEIRLDTLDSGITISNISTQLAATVSKRGPLPRFIVRQTQGELLGGSFTADDMVYDPNRNINSMLIRLQNIDLAEVVKTQQLENITATGRIDGSLPVEITKNGIHIADGGMSNHIRGGVIRYTPRGGTAQLRQNTLTGMALDALKDFRYSKLQAEVNYLPDGELTINLGLKGTSPELDKNRPVKLNINTEQNLLTLLKSLRFAQGVSDSIDEKVRRMYQKSH